MYRRMGQQDSHEVLRRLVDGLKEENTKKDEAGKPLPTYIDKVFAGKLVSVVVCDTCHHVSYSYEDFMDLSLAILSDVKKGKADKQITLSNGARSTPDNSIDAITNGIQDMELEGEKDAERAALIKSLLRPAWEADAGARNVTIERCVAEFMSVEVLDGKDAYQCEACAKRKKEEDGKRGEEMQNGADVKSESDKMGNEEKNDEIRTTGGDEEVAGTSEAGVEAAQSDSDSKPAAAETVQAGPIRAGEEANGDSDVEEAPPAVDRFGNTIEPSGEAAPTSPSTQPAGEDPVALSPPSSPKPKAAQPPAALSRAHKRYLIHTLPQTLVIHLKRFQQIGIFSSRTRKIDDPVAFDEFISLDPWLAPPKPSDASASAPSKQKGRKYRLYGVVVHMGGLFGGHYIAYVRLDGAKAKEAEGNEDEGVGGWAYCSDTHVRRCGWEEVQKSQAYLLFYERV
ncbi:hypothetical protein HK104_002640 [Borealophlyctis nickersoniae]|nr:hypothetical protein HK104_002640 [Borealophlyctis nickersoniae]